MNMRQYVCLPGSARRSGSQRGDTIVEVLIATAIVSLILASAYALTNKNVLSIQAAQEQQYAQKLAEQQIELLRSASPAPNVAGCFDTSSGNLGMYASPTTNTACKVTSGNLNYDIAVTPTGLQYAVQVSWDALGGNRAKVTLYYRIAG
ncbi:prepilin-type N-terminal cleavage/methylation domain-containing protein [Candidatus Saccharibacteria bacterium]|nr:prepilin-type N-terminal cleavage/methylation domain-containing protein [Candidatus Saccharibacteria bacterium]